VCDGQGACVHPSLDDFVASNDGDADTVADWCQSGVCGGFFVQVENRQSSQLVSQVAEQYRRAAPGPDGDSVAGLSRYFNGAGAVLNVVTHYALGSTPPSLVLGSVGGAPALNGKLIAQGATLWEYIGGQWDDSMPLDGLHMGWSGVGSGPSFARLERGSSGSPTTP
jgi:hypothetical protein